MSWTLMYIRIGFMYAEDGSLSFFLPGIGLNFSRLGNEANLLTPNQ